MPDHKRTYAQEATVYERLVMREDYQHHLLTAIQQIATLTECNVLEMGAGTGRLTCLLAPYVRSIQAFDLSQPMLDIAAAKLRKTGNRNWGLGVADHRRLPVGDHRADIVIAGWSICYLVTWQTKTWQREVSRALLEIKRVQRPGGVTIIIETLGTGYTEPHPPERLAAYYRFLKTQGFSNIWIRTDYQFENLQEAKSLVDFFFGETLAKQVAAERQVYLPECTGIWWHRFGSSAQPTDCSS